MRYTQEKLKKFDIMLLTSWPALENAFDIHTFIDTHKNIIVGKYKYKGSTSPKIEHSAFVNLNCAPQIVRIGF